MGTLLSLLLVLPVLSGGALQVSVLPDGTVRVPIRVTDNGAAKRPEVYAVPGGVSIEVPDGKVERGSTAGTGEIETISAATSHSRHRAVITLHPRPGATLAADRVEAQLGEGMVILRVQGAPGTVPGPMAAPRKVAAAAVPAEGAKGAAQAAAGSGWGSAAPGAALEGHSPSTLALRVGVALGLLALAAFLALRHRRARAGDVRPAAIDIVATRMLGKTQRLVVVDVDQQRFLLAASEQGGVRLVSSMGMGMGQGAGQKGAAEKPAEKGSIAEKPAAADPLGEVFADMLADVGRPTVEPQRKETRPALHLVPEEQESDSQAPARGRANPPPLSTRASAGISSIEQGSGSADVAGLLALRKNRQGARR